MKSDNGLMPLSFTRALRLKVRREAYRWLNAAAAEVNQVFHYCNETSLKAGTRTDAQRKWTSGLDLCNLAAGTTEYFDRIGTDAIQSVCTHYARTSVSRNESSSWLFAPSSAYGVREAGIASAWVAA